MEIGNKMIKLSWKFKITSVILTALIFVGLLMLKDYIIENDFQNIYSYILQGVLFGFFMGIALPYVTKKFGKSLTLSIVKNIKPELTENEEIENEGPANLFRGMEAVGGKLILTNKKIIFKSHKLNIQNGQTHIDYRDIENITEQKTAKLIDNGIRIKTKDRKDYDFVVNEREKWIDKLNEKLK